MDEAKREAEAFYNVAMMAKKIFVEDFLPPLRTVMLPSPYERLFFAQTDRVARFLESLEALNDPVYLPTHVAVIRSIFEISVDICLLENVESVLSDSADPRAVIVERYHVLGQRQSINFFYRMTSSESTEVADRGRQALARRESLTDEEEGRVFGNLQRNRRHWVQEQLSERVKTLDRICGSESRFTKWYENEYHLASQYIHGTLAPMHLVDDPRQSGWIVSSFFFPWLAGVLQEGVMLPVFRALRLTDSHKGAVERIKSLPALTNQIFANVLEGKEKAHGT